MATVERDKAAVGRTRSSRELDENSAVDSATRKQEIARRLKLSERVLEQYFQSKQAEVEDDLDLSAVPALTRSRTGREKRV